MSLPSPSPQGTALITGASSGIGAALARVLAERGYGVTLIARDKDRLHAIAEEIRVFNIRVEIIGVDLTDRGARREIEARIEQAGLHVDILINCAAAATRGTIAECDLDAEFGHLELNVLSVVDLCRTFVPGMVDRGAGAVLNVASTAAFKPLSGQGTYAAAKAFVLAFTHTLQVDLQDTPVTVTALCPGPVPTDFARRAGFSAEDAAVYPKMMWKSAEEVATVAVDAMEGGSELCIPGRANVADATICLSRAKGRAAQAVSR